MTVCNVEMPSYTYAVKAEKLLLARGYPCEIKRIDRPGSSTCGFMLSIRGHCREAIGILKNYSVPFTQIIGEEFDNAGKLR